MFLEHNFPLREVLANEWCRFQGTGALGVGGWAAGWPWGLPCRACRASVFGKIVYPLVGHTGHLGFSLELLLKNTDQHCVWPSLDEDFLSLLFAISY